ncbi:MAG: hypothetical protein ABIY55_19890, partial [Kofleriaceae bacterium]
MPDKQILKPTEFTVWQQSRTLFASHLGATETYVFDGPDGARGDGRIAYGKCQQGFWFYISMTRAQEAEFASAYKEWRASNPGHSHTYTAAANGVFPPNCGTPNTPACGSPKFTTPTPIKCGIGCL